MQLAVNVLKNYLNASMDGTFIKKIKIIDNTLVYSAIYPNLSNSYTNKKLPAGFRRQFHFAF